MPSTLDWLLASDEPWTRYCTFLNLLGLPPDDADVCRARTEMLAHPLIAGLIADVRAWPGYPLARHNDAAHPIHKLGVLLDFGLIARDPGMAETLAAICAHPSSQGSLQTMIRMEWHASSTRGDFWTWMACDAPLLLHAVIGIGGRDQPAAPPALDHLLNLTRGDGWRCAVAPELGRFHGPGRKDDPCPIATLYALQALSLCPDLLDHPAARVGVEMLLYHWEQRRERKFFLFAMGTDFAKLKYPSAWYDLLHVVDVLAHFPLARADVRFREMLAVLAGQADSQGRYTASSMYQAWKAWSFADKKKPSPWLTYRVLRTLQCAGAMG